MLLLKTLLLLLTASICNAYGQHCRQCKGKQTLTFKSDVHAGEALDFLVYSFQGCATGYDYTILNIVQTGRTWVYDLIIWRYCGTGGSSYVNRGPRCYNKICTSEDVRTLTCTRTVKCKSECDYPWCGV